APLTNEYLNHLCHKC
nr:RecName: Full=20 kDa pollen coat protein [Brassica napus]